MADLKLRPRMDKPKLRETMAAPKDAASMLKKQFEAQQRERQPGQKSPERYATDRVEDTAKGAAVVAADRMRKTMQKQRRKRDREKLSEDRRKPADTTAAPRQGDHHITPHGERYSSAPVSGSAQFFGDGLSKPTVGDAAPPRLQETMTPAPPSVEERGRTLARAKYRTELNRRVEIERWEARPDYNRPGVKVYQRAWEESPTSFSGQKQPAPTASAQGREFGKTLTEKNTPLAVREQNCPQGIPRKPERTIGRAQAAFHPAAGHPQTSGILSLEGTTRQKGRRLVQKNAQQELLKQSAEASRKAASAGGRSLQIVVTSVGRAVAKAASSLSAAGVGLALLVLFLLVIAIGGLTASPFSILFAGESTGPETVSVSAAVAQVNLAFNAKLEELQAENYDSVTVAGSTADWVDVLAVFAVKTAGAETLDVMDVATLDPTRVEKLKKVFLEMNVITTEVESIQHPGGENSAAWTERILHITITPKKAAEMVETYHFTSQQQAMLKELLEQRELLEALIGDLFHMSAEARAVLEQLPDDLSEERKAVIREACSLVGKVGYFWGGKSLTLGWDSRWGQLKQVTASGSPTTGTYRPYGLDCSGFVDWVFYNATKGELVLGQGGGARMQHSVCRPISWDEAMPGDLVFYPNDTHVGIVCGKNESGELLIVHCASGVNNVVITGKGGFVSIGRPQYYAKSNRGNAANLLRID